jgi:hypothetical protein
MNRRVTLVGNLLAGHFYFPRPYGMAGSRRGHFACDRMSRPPSNTGKAIQPSISLCVPHHHELASTTGRVKAP